MAWASASRSPAKESPVNLSKFEKQSFSQIRPVLLDENGKVRVRPQRSKIPRTTQVKRLYAKTGKLVPLRKWAKESDETVAHDWLKAK
jgi:hypothetical protein